MKDCLLSAWKNSLPTFVSCNGSFRRSSKSIKLNRDQLWVQSFYRLSNEIGINSFRHIDRHRLIDHFRDVFFYRLPPPGVLRVRLKAVSLILMSQIIIVKERFVNWRNFVSVRVGVGMFITAWPIYRTCIFTWQNSGVTVITNYNFPGGYSDGRDDFIMLASVPMSGKC